MILKNKLVFSLLALAVLALVAFIFIMFQQPQAANGSVAVSNDYLSTSTAPTASQGAFVLATTRTLKNSGAGCALGSVIITGAGAAGLDFYNATTSNVSLRTGQKATTTILMASLPPALVAGTYTFDVSCTDGLLMNLSGSGVPTTTVTFR